MCLNRERRCVDMLALSSIMMRASKFISGMDATLGKTTQGAGVRAMLGTPQVLTSPPLSTKKCIFLHCVKFPCNF